MKNNHLFWIILISITLTIVGTSCHPDHSTKLDAQSLEINQFIWYNMQYYYLWTDSVSNLTSFQPNSTALDNFLNGYSDHSKLFDALLYPKRDNWSWIVDDYVALENSFLGLTLSKGFDFGLAYTDKYKTNIFGFVHYVAKGSPAAIAGIKRGDLFNKIDNQLLTVSNYQSLLTQDAYTLGLASIVNNAVTANGRNIAITAVQFQENPIFMDTVFNVQGTNVGYLMYNQFESNYDIQLNSVFDNFKNKGVTQLVLDLRYNGGGSVQSAIYLACMIYNTSSANIIIKTQYNKKLHAYYLSEKGSDYFNEYFTDTIARTTATATTPATPTTTITSLGLKRLFVLTSGNTASASEIIINALRAYIPVTTIGTTTVGKYVASFTIYDYITDKDRNPNHKWALQPIVLKIANKDGVSDFVDGFSPDIEVDEFSYVDNLTPLGNEQEPLLNAALNAIKGNITVKSSNIRKFDRVGDAKDLKPHGKEMFVRPEFFKK